MPVFASKGEVHAIELITKDSYILIANLKYPEIKKKKYPLVVLLHSYGLSSAEWRELPLVLNNNGFAVLEIDFRGHGKSVYLSNSKQRSHIYLREDSLRQFPNDVYQKLRQAYSTYGNLAGDELLFLGADVGANTAIFVAEALEYKPIALVLITPQVDFKGLYTPIALAEAGEIPILGIITKNDKHSRHQISSLQKYAQGSFSLLNLPQGGPGMTCLAVNKGAVNKIVKWMVNQTPSLTTKSKT